ncbi:MAG TPA: PEP-CTERM sorting domain-containing protein [Stellaceae bacterium]|jgi:hypothetical protein
MYAFLARYALRLSPIAIPLVALSFIAGAPSPAKADACSVIEPAAFPNLPNETGGGAVVGCTATVSVDRHGILSVQQNVNPAYDNSGDSIIAFTNNSSSSIFDLFVWGSTNKPIFDPTRPLSETLCGTLGAGAVHCGPTGDEGTILNTLGQKIGFVVFSNIGNSGGPGCSPTPDNCADILFDIGGVTSGGLPVGDVAIFGLTEPQFLAELSAPTKVPEPASLAVLGMGLLGLAFYRFRLRLRRRAAAALKPQHA